MPRSLSRGLVAALATLIASFSYVAAVSAEPARTDNPADDGAITWTAPVQHGSSTLHLPSVTSNMELVSKLELTQPFGNVLPEQIADVGVHKGFAYLASWRPPGAGSNTGCPRGGFFTVDIRNPAAPRFVGFQRSLPGNYHGEGVHAIELNTSAFKGDVLALNNETVTCQADENTLAAGGGIDLWDVSDPANPKPLARAVGDSGPDDGKLVGTEKIKHQSHSVFLWQDGGKAYAVFTDNEELHDVDIFDITDPRNPQPVAEHYLAQKFPQVRDTLALGSLINHHDVIVKEIDGVQTMLVSYWDAGYVMLNVENPADPKYIADTSYDGADPITGYSPPEGNAHQAEFSFDNKYILAADEDFEPYRFIAKITSGPNSGHTWFDVGTGNRGPTITPETPLTGDTRFVGDACSALPAGSGNGLIALIERGTCTFAVKVNNVENAGYKAALIFNDRRSPGGCESLINMDLSADPPAIPSLFLRRSDGFKIMNAYDPATYSCGPANGAGTAAPAAPRDGENVSFTVEFDAWGYAHLLRNGTGKLQYADHYAIDEALDERFAQDFGDLSIHEWAADPTEHLGYASYYSGGMRVARFADGKLTETGAFIDAGGSNFWGVEQFTGPDGERYIAGSDRDYGLYILRYTGPGAAKPPTCQDVTVNTEYGKAVEVPLRCSDVNGNPLTLSIVTQPGRGTLGAIDQAKDTVTYTPKTTPNGAGFTDTFTYRAADPAAAGQPAKVTVNVRPDVNAQCAVRTPGFTEGKDLVHGTLYGDWMVALGGDDTLDGLEGRDCLEGGAGRDRLLGGTNDDRIDGGTGNDHVNGGPGDDVVDGSTGDDYVAGGSNNDRVNGGAGRDSLRGEAGNDRIFGGGGNDRLDAGKGRNRLSGGAGNDRLFAANGAVDNVRCGTGTDSVKADGNDKVSRDCERVSRTRRTR